MRGLQIEVIDKTRGRYATGMRVDVFALGAGARKLCSATVNANGLVDDPALMDAIPAGEYEVVFHIGRFFAQSQAAMPTRPLLDTIPFRFSIANGEGYRLPVRIAPWAFSLDV